MGAKGRTGRELRASFIVREWILLVELCSYAHALDRGSNNRRTILAKVKSLLGPGIAFH